MKARLLPFVACLVFVGCTSVLDELAIGGYLVLDQADVNAPDWLSDKLLVANSGENIVELSAATAETQETRGLGLENVENSFHVDLSPDGTRVALIVQFTGQDDGDIIVFNLTNEVSTNITTNSGNFHGPAFLNNSKVTYVEYDDSVTDVMTNRIIIHDLVTDVATPLVETPPYVYTGSEIEGEVYWLAKGSPDGSKILVGADDYPAIDQSFAVFDSDTGVKIYDGYPTTTTGRIVMGDWVDEDTIVIGLGDSGDQSIQVIDISSSPGEVLVDVPVVDERVTWLYGVRVSPDGTMVVSSAAEHDDVGDWQRNWLVVTRIAAPPE